MQLARAQHIIGRALVSRYAVLAIDLALCLVSFLLASLLRFNFHVPANVVRLLPYTAVFVLAARALGFWAFKSFSGVVQYTSEKDASRVVKALAVSSVIIFGFNRHTYLLPDYIFLPMSVVVIDFVMSFFLLMSFKVGVKWIYAELRQGLFNRPAQVPTVIFGAGRSGLITKRAIDNDPEVHFEVVAFFDDNPTLHGKIMEGVRIYNPVTEFAEVANRLGVRQAIISMQAIAPVRKQAFIDQCLEFGMQALTLPPASRWLNGELQVNQLRKVKIEDLLDRETIRLDSGPIRDQVEGKTILITGAAGSIGSEIVRQLTYFAPLRLIMVDSAESPLVELHLRISEEMGYTKAVPLVADVTNRARMDHIFDAYEPEIVFHAAAYKHVPIMEDIPYEAVRVNVAGTKNLADLSIKYGVARFVMVSTDKAVNPTNVMGSSKRIAEIYTQALNDYLTDTPGTRFITTRFGNVLGSNGSVIPRFRRQIEQGGPVTVTHPDITRYFMTIPEACQLVLEAGAMGRGGEIYIFDMGQSVRIADLAARMIKLSGLVPGKDIQVVYTGLRPGEKLEEELLARQEATQPTHHPKIMIAKVRSYPFERVKADIDDLLKVLEGQDDRAIVRKMKLIVPEFLSNNSVFKELDAGIA